jgi:hypothetical protein
MMSGFAAGAIENPESLAAAAAAFASNGYNAPKTSLASFAGLTIEARNGQTQSNPAHKTGATVWHPLEDTVGLSLSNYPRPGATRSFRGVAFR